MRRRRLLGAVLATGALAILLPSTAAALSQGTLSGVVTGQNGPVAGALVVAKGVTNLANTTTAPDGTYSVAAWPDTYDVAVEPPAKSPDGFTTKPGFVVNEGATTTANITLSEIQGSTRVAGNASYSDHSPDAGVQVSVYEEHFAGGLIKGRTTFTDESGNWDAGELPSGIYRVGYGVNVSNGGPGNRTNWNVGGSLDFLRPGESQNLSETLSGPKPEGMIEATLTAAEGWPSLGFLNLIFPGEPPELGLGGADGVTRLFAPTGSYSLEAQPWREDADISQVVPVAVTNGHVTHVSIQFSPLSSSSGISAQQVPQELAWLNAQRARWGLPAGIVNVPLWSNDCAAHDNYGYRNGRLEHNEDSMLPGASPGGYWAGTHAVLAEGGGWAEEEDPWYDAPIHLLQLFAPSLSAIGLDDSHGFECATTWPGIYSGALKERNTPGTISTFPGDGTTGVPPVELAYEAPTTPNKILGIPDLAGRELLVYEYGTEVINREIEVLSASLSSASGPVKVKWIEQYPGAIVVPVEPLKPFTSYQASVTLAGFTTNRGVEVPQITHSWRFSTGHENPNGDWAEPKPGPEKPRGPQRSVSTRWKRGHIIVKGWNFSKGEVVIKRKVLLKSERRFDGVVLAKAQTNAKGTFLARFRWPRRHIAFRVYQNGNSTFGIYNPPHPPSWYRHHRHRHGH